MLHNERNAECEEREEMVGENDFADDNQAKTDAAVQRGEELVERMPEGNDMNPVHDPQLRMARLRKTEKHKKAANMVNVKNLEINVGEVAKKWKNWRCEKWWNNKKRAGVDTDSAGENVSLVALAECEETQMGNVTL